MIMMITIINPLRLSIGQRSALHHMNDVDKQTSTMVMTLILKGIYPLSLLRITLRTHVCS